MKNKKIIRNFIILIIIIFLSLIMISINYAKKDNARFTTTEDTRVVTTKKSNMQDKTLKEDNVMKTLKYKESKLGKDVYISDEGYEYDFDGDKLVSFWKSIDEVSAEKITEKEAEIVAREFSKKSIENFEKYELLSNDYDEITKQYRVIYINKVQGYNTIDEVIICVDNERKIKSFIAYYQGVFEKYKNINIDKKAIEEAVSEEIKNKYGDKLIDFKISGQNLSIVEKKCVMIVGVEVKLKADTKDEKGNSYVFSAGETILYNLE